MEHRTVLRALLPVIDPERNITETLAISLQTNCPKPSKTHANWDSARSILYPMVTIHGEECHNEWEITFEEIHRNNIIVYAIMQFSRVTGNKEYIAYYGLEVMIAISRFWSQRVSFSEARQKYVLLGVTGPNEYENNVNNNWYTNYSCMQCLQSTIECLEMVAHEYPEEYNRIRRSTEFRHAEETARWKEIIEKMYLPEDKEQGIFVQDDGYPDKVLGTVDDIPVNERPINQHWSWDRILRSCYIKQSDVLLGLFLYYEHFDRETIRRNFRFYEPRTVHESSLSPFVHAILAAWIGRYRRSLPPLPTFHTPGSGRLQQRGAPRPARHQYGRKLANHCTRIRRNENTGRTTRLHSHHSRSMGQLYFQSKFPQLHLTDESRKTKR